MSSLGGVLPTDDRCSLSFVNDKKPGCHTHTYPVVGITKTSNNHQSILEKVGNSDRFSVKTGDECKGQKFQNVVFCAPPSGFEDYPSAVEEAVSNLWAGPDEGGAFVFTSSGGM